MNVKPKRTLDACLDIETTHLSPEQGEISIIGIYLPQLGDYICLSGSNISKTALLSYLDNVSRLFTLNGRNFDLKLIRQKLDVDLEKIDGMQHIDLRYVCKRCGLTGGLKAIEIKLNISRKTIGIDGSKAAKWGIAWLTTGHKRAYNLLVKYNEEDCKNLYEIVKYLDFLVNW
mgnify:CR=1 FL=1